MGKGWHQKAMVGHQLKLTCGEDVPLAEEGCHEKSTEMKLGQAVMSREVCDFRNGTTESSAP